jgi:hypothetical protein
MPNITEITAVSIDPETGKPWLRRLDTRTAKRYLREVHGIEIGIQTLVHHRSQGIGIRWRYFGQKPLTTPPEVDRYVREDAFQDVSPLTRSARDREARRQARRGAVAAMQPPIPA